MGKWYECLDCFKSFPEERMLIYRRKALDSEITKGEFVDIKGRKVREIPKCPFCRGAVKESSKL